MTFERRLVVAGLLAVFAVASLTAAKRFSVPLIAYVVEEALVQKLPAGTDPSDARRKFRDLISGLPGRQMKLDTLLAMSQYLERLQTVDPQELERLMAPNPAMQPGARP